MPQVLDLDKPSPTSDTASPTSGTAAAWDTASLAGNTAADPAWDSPDAWGIADLHAWGMVSLAWDKEHRFGRDQPSACDDDSPLQVVPSAVYWHTWMDPSL